MSARSGARRQARRRRRLRGTALLLAALLVTGATVYVGLRSTSPDPEPVARPRPTPSPTETDLDGLDLSDLPIRRTAFCDALDEDDIETALGGPPTGTAHYDSGDRVELTDGVTDVSHEYNCTFDSVTSGAQARVWVFAEPVTVGVARSLVREGRTLAGCSQVDEAPAYGTPSLATLCRTTSPPTRAVTLRGLFGDAWLSCRLSTPGGGDATETRQAVRRAEQWCVRVATTLGARP